MDFPRRQRKELPQGTRRIRWQRCIPASRKTKPALMVGVPDRMVEKAASRDDPRQTKAWVVLAIWAAETGSQATGVRHLPGALAKDLASLLKPVDLRLMVLEAAKEPSVPLSAAALFLAAAPPLACFPALCQESRTSALLPMHLASIHEVPTKEATKHPAPHQEAAEKEGQVEVAVAAEEVAVILGRVATMLEASVTLCRLVPVAQRSGPRSPMGRAHCASQSPKTKREAPGLRDYRRRRAGSHNWGWPSHQRGGAQI